MLAARQRSNHTLDTEALTGRPRTEDYAKTGVCDYACGALVHRLRCVEWPASGTAVLLEIGMACRFHTCSLLLLDPPDCCLNSSPLIAQPKGDALHVPVEKLNCSQYFNFTGACPDYFFPRTGWPGLDLASLRRLWGFHRRVFPQTAGKLEVAPG